MKGYETYFARCIDPARSDRYVDYGLLKDELRRFYDRRRELSRILKGKEGTGLTVDAFSRLAGGGGGGTTTGSGGGTTTGSGTTTGEAVGGYFRYGDADEGGSSALVDEGDALLRLSVIERKEFSSLLEAQISASAIFYSSELLPGVRRLAEDREYDAAATELLEAVAFACTNIITFRQLLTRYDAFRRTFDGMPLNEWHLQRSVLDADHPVHGLFALEGVEELEKRIVLSMQTSRVLGGSGGHDDDEEEDGVLVQKRKEEEEEDGVLVREEDAAGSVDEGGEEAEKRGDGAKPEKEKEDGASMTAEEFAAQIQSFAYLLDKTDTSLDKAVRGHLVFKDRMVAFWTRMRGYLLFGFQSRGLYTEPKSVSMRGRHFKKEIKVIGKWRTSRDFAHFSIEEEERGTFRQNLKDVSPENGFPLFLNLVSCFLFMMNNYIIEPSSAYYAEALGSSDALSGLMIGAAPWFALTSSVAYSYWTNYNYKQPILFAGTLQFVGNLMYANAYGYRSVELCLIGRAITGLGAPRIINRRYVADATPFSLRTAASAAFAMATALGAALGPGMAILLNRMDEFEFRLPLLKEQYFNGMTAPGYFMALSWFVYTLCIIFFFGEPTRSGLEELRQREGSGGPTAAETDSKKTSLLSEVELAAVSQDSNNKGAGLDAKESMRDDDVERQDSSPDDFDDDGSATKDDASHVDAPPTGKGRGDQYCGCIKNMTRPVIICMSLIFMKRIALESIVGSTSIVTKNRYGWNIENVGTLHLVNGIIVIPVSVFSGYLSTLYEDRLMSVWFLAITLLGMAFLFDPTDLWNREDGAMFNEGAPLATGPARYIAGSLIAFSGIEACESYVASLMSKVVPSALAQGTFNSGLLATLVGTGGRAVGDIFITLMGLISIRNLLNLLIIPGASLVGFSILLILWNYELLAV